MKKEIKIGKSSWNKGIKTPMEVRKKQSESHKGKVGFWAGKRGVLKANRTSFKKGMIPWNKGIPNPNFQGKKNPKWRGELVGYDALHDWVNRKFGRAKSCEHCHRTGLKPRSYQWANKTGLYKREREDWLSLCASCHKIYDTK